MRRYQPLGVAVAVARRRRRRSRLRLGVVAVVLCLASLGSGVVIVERLVTARREMRAVKVQLAKFWVAMTDYKDEPARQALDKAQVHLGRAWKAGSGFPGSLIEPVPLAGSPLRALESAYRAASEIIAAGRIVVDTMRDLPDSVGKGDDDHLAAVRAAALRSLDDVIRAEQRLAAAGYVLEGPAGAFLPPISERAQRMQAKVGEAGTKLDKAKGALDLLAALTAGDVDARLLVVAQDSTELRPTGGDIGSFGVLHIHGGQVDLERYAAADSLPPPNPPVPAPAELGPDITARGWDLTNANWWPDFPKSAANIADMFQRQGGGTVDGVIALSDLMMARLLSVLGSVRVPGYAQPVTGDDLAKRLVQEIELKRPPDNPRKKFLIGLADVMFDKLSHLPAGQATKVLAAVHDGAAAGEIQAWFARPEWQHTIAGTEWSGELPTADAARDFLMLVESNLANTRSNLDLVRAARYSVTRRGDGRLAAHLEITYRNHGERSSINPGYDGLVHLYVPRGSELTDGTMAIDAEDGPYGYFARTVQVAPKAEAVVSFDYVLPGSVADDGTYELTWMRQTGTPKDSLAVTIGAERFDANPADRTFEVDARLP